MNRELKCAKLLKQIRQNHGVTLNLRIARRADLRTDGARRSPDSEKIERLQLSCKSETFRAWSKSKTGRNGDAKAAALQSRLMRATKQIQGLSMFIKSISIDRCRIKFGMTASCAERVPLTHFSNAHKFVLKNFPLPQGAREHASFVKQTDMNLSLFTSHFSRKCKRYAFTLAEVLITLGIIGVVAALTLPSVIQKYKEKQTVTQLKKAYSILSQGYLIAVSENETPDNWELIGADSGEGAVNMTNIFSKYLKMQKICGLEKGCLPDVIYKYQNGSNQANFDYYTHISKVVLFDGMLLYFQVNSADCSAYDSLNQPPLNRNCGTIMVDINGFKAPNQKGVDVFYFMLNKTGIYPFGLENDNVVPFKDKCYNDGFSCAGWVLVNENLDYNHCTGLDWNTKTKCK